MESNGYCRMLFASFALLALMSTAYARPMQIEKAWVPPELTGVSVGVFQAYMENSWWEPVYIPYIEITNNEPLPIMLNRFASGSGSVSHSVYYYWYGVPLCGFSEPPPCDEMPMDDDRIRNFNTIVMQPGETVCFGSRWLPRSPNCADTKMIQINPTSQPGGGYQYDISFSAATGSCNSNGLGSFTVRNFTVDYTILSRSMRVTKDSPKKTVAADINVPCMGFFN